MHPCTPSRPSAAGRLVALILCTWALAFAATVSAAGTEVRELVIKYRDDALAKGAVVLPPALLQRIGSALQVGFVETGRTRDGAVRLALIAPLDVDAARAALNRLRLQADVLYAAVAPPAPTSRPGARVKALGAASPPTTRLIVKYRDPVRVSALLAGFPMARLDLDQLSAVAGMPVAFVRPMADGASVLTVMRRMPIEDLEAVARQLAAQPDIEWAQPDYIDHIALNPTDPCYASPSTGACNSGYQWDLFDPVGGVNAPAAWNLTTGSASITVSVIDTGALLSHPDLAGRFFAGYDMIDDALVANDNDPNPMCTETTVGGCFGSRDSSGADPGDWLFAASTSDPNNWFYQCNFGSSSFHGTHVSGTIGAIPNNGIGIAGLNWVSKIVPVRVLGRCGGYSSDIADGITWASGGTVTGLPVNTHPARVLNLSLGGFRSSATCDPAYSGAISGALGRNAVIVVAAGNNNYDSIHDSPGNCPGVITVAATGEHGFKAYYSNFGTGVEIAAPGGDRRFQATYNPNQRGILSSLNSGTQVFDPNRGVNVGTSPDPAGYEYVEYTGTSMATPHVVGIVSLMLSANTALTPSQVLSKLQTSARAFQTGAPVCSTANVPDGNGIGSVPSSSWFGCTCTTALCGAGFADAYRAVLVSIGVATTTTLVSSANPANPGSSVTFTANVTGVAPTGTVGFTADGSAISGCAAVALAGTGDARTAACSNSALPAGTHAIVASYSGDGNDNPSLSATLTQTISGTVTLAKRKIDFDGDGKQDLVWRNSSTGEVSVWLMNGLTYSSAAIIYADPAYTVTNTGDLSGDGRTDLIWRHTSGATVGWLMNGTSYITYATLLSDPNWNVVRTADFNGDGKADLLWRNSSNGQTSIWLMNGLAPTASAIVLSDPNWQVTQVGDFNGDGKADLVWRNSSTGQTALWLMNGTAILSSAFVMGDPNWSVTHVGDFNGDGKSDLVWRNSSTGQVAIWLMDGVNASSAAVIFGDANWQVTNVGDFDGNGKSDLVWRHSGTGQTAVWLMNGTTAASSAIVMNDPNWRVTHVTDSNNDGKSDLVWRNSASSSTTIWLMNGTGYSSFATLLSDPNWLVSPADGL